MNKKFWLTFVGAFVVMFAISGLLHMVIFTGFIENTYANVPKTGGFDFRTVNKDSISYVFLIQVELLHSSGCP